ncbi:MAG: peptide chain release factor N(5)-glutamine methyltransferase [Verrucomicrobiales bacterium]
MARLEGKNATVLAVIDASTEFLKKHQIESPKTNAQQLLAMVLEMDRTSLYMNFEQVLSEAELTEARALVKRRAEGVPLQHLLGTVQFLDWTFKTDGRALIPRHETELLVDNLRRRWQTQVTEPPEEQADGVEPKPGQVSWPCPKSLLDVGTGSGVIALALALSFPEMQVFACDKSEEALALAQENATKLGGKDRVQWLVSDLFAALPADLSFDAVVANLPYIPRGEIAELSREVKADPHLALDGGDDGLELIRHCIADAPGRLNPGGLLMLEIGFDQATQVMDLLNSANFHDIQVDLDYEQRERFVSGRYG